MTSRVPFVGPSYKLDTLEADCQRVVNMYPAADEVGGGKTGVYLESIPGLDLFSPEAPPTPPVCNLSAFPVIEADEAMHFLDNFTGTNGEDLELHESDLNPSETGWEVNSEGPQAFLLDGSVIGEGSPLNAMTAYQNVPGIYGFSESNRLRIRAVVGLFGQSSENPAEADIAITADGVPNSQITLIFSESEGIRLQWDYSEFLAFVTDSVPLPYCEWVDVDVYITQNESDPYTIQIYVNGELAIEAEAPEAYDFNSSDTTALALTLFNETSNAIRVAAVVLAYGPLA